MSGPSLLPRLEALIKTSLPSLAVRRVAALIGPRIRFTGDYPTWEAASADASGYAHAGALEAAAQQTLEQRSQALRGGDDWFRGRLRHSWPVLAGLLGAASREGGRLSVLDFGGGLGALQFVLRPLLGGLRDLRWSIVEQPHVVSRGRAQFADGVLRFHESAEESVAAERPNVLLLAGVLQYLPEPFAQLERLLALEIPHVIVDRTLLLEGDADRLAVQRLPPSLGRASYPCWLFGATPFPTRFPAYELAAAFESTLDASATVGGRQLSSQGFVFRRRGVL